MNRKLLFNISTIGFGLILAAASATARVHTPRFIRLLPTAVEDRAFKIFNGVSQQARAWILDQARSRVQQHDLSLESMRTAANQKFGGAHPLTAYQQDELALAILDQMMKLDDAERRRLAGAASSGRPVATDDGSPKTGSSDKASPKAEGGKSNSSTVSAELQTVAADYSKAQALAESVLKRMSNSSDSVVGKL